MHRLAPRCGKTLASGFVRSGLCVTVVAVQCRNPGPGLVLWTRSPSGLCQSALLGPSTVGQWFADRCKRWRRSVSDQQVLFRSIRIAESRSFCPVGNTARVGTAVVVVLWFCCLPLCLTSNHYTPLHRPIKQTREQAATTTTTTST